MGILEGKSVLVAGVTMNTSIGYRIAELAAEQGATVLVSNFGRALSLTRRIIKRLDPEPVLLEVDVTNEEHLAGLADQLRQHGWHPGIVSRGYGRSGDEVRPVTVDSLPAAVGDEPLLLARHTGLPVWVGRARAEAGRALLAAHPEVDVVLCDDGLQHYALARDVEQRAPERAEVAREEVRGGDGGRAGGRSAHRSLLHFLGWKPEQIANGIDELASLHGERLCGPLHAKACGAATSRRTRW